MTVFYYNELAKADIPERLKYLLRSAHRHLLELSYRHKSRSESERLLCEQHMVARFNEKLRTLPITQRVMDVRVSGQNEVTIAWSGNYYRINLFSRPVKSVDKCTAEH